MVIKQGSHMSWKNGEKNIEILFFCIGEEKSWNDDCVPKIKDKSWKFTMKH